MKHLITNKGLAIIDDEDYDRLARYTWSFNGSRVCRTLWQSGKTRKTITILLANDVLQDYISTYDHIDRNPLNNIKSNLREATHQQNMFNRTKQKGTSSKYKGVTWLKTTNKWKAQIQINKKHVYLGSFLLEIDAAEAYDKAAKRCFGKFAALNLPQL